MWCIIAISLEMAMVLAILDRMGGSLLIQAASVSTPYLFE
jgi:hypothetical protein